MVFFKSDADKSDLLGKILVCLSFFILLYMIYYSFKYPFLSVDEWYSKGIIKLSINNIIKASAVDVHPPLYYFILKLGMKFFSIMGIKINAISLMELISVIPYIIIFCISITEIKKDYGHLTCGLFLFTTITTSEFFRQFLTARMYSWSILFLILSFICVRSIINKNDMKHWILLSIFSVLCAYTHYFAAISSIVIYLLLLGYIIKNNKSSIKEWLISTIIGIVCYIPWMLILFNQLSSVHQSYWIQQITLENMIIFFSFALTSIEEQIFQVISFIIILICIYSIFKKYLENNDEDNTYALFGALTFLGTILIGSIISFVFKPILIERYLIPSIAVFWLGFSIYISKINIKRYIPLIIIVLLVMGCANVACQSDDIHHIYYTTKAHNKYIDSINNEDTIIIFASLNKYLRLHENFNKVSEKYTNYYFNNTTTNLSDYNLGDVENGYFNITLENIKNTDKNIYFITKSNEKFNETGFKIQKVENIAPCGIYKFST